MEMRAAALHDWEVAQEGKKAGVVGSSVREMCKKCS